MSCGNSSWPFDSRILRLSLSELRHGNTCLDRDNSQTFLGSKQCEAEVHCQEILLHVLSMLVLMYGIHWLWKKWFEEVCCSLNSHASIFHLLLVRRLLSKHQGKVLMRVQDRWDYRKPNVSASSAATHWNNLILLSKKSQVLCKFLPWAHLTDFFPLFAP